MASVDKPPLLTTSITTAEPIDYASTLPSHALVDDLVSYVFDRKYLIGGTEKIFINAKNDGQFVTYDNATKMVKEMAAGLRKQGLTRGECVCVHSYNDIRYPLIWLGIVAAGGVVTGSNPAYTSSEIVHHFKITNTKFIIAQNSCLPAIHKAAQECGIQDESIFLLDGVQSQERSTFKSWTVLLDQTGPPDTDHKDVVCDCPTSTSNVVCYAATSGTTGLPKAAKLTHRYFIDQLRAIESLFVGREERVCQLHYLPIFHVFAAPLALLLPLRLGISTYLLPRFNQTEFIDAVDQYQITDTAAVPPIVAGLANLPDEDRMRLRSLRFMLCAGSPLATSVHKSFCTAYHSTLVLSQCWGCTEIGWISVFAPTEKDISGSVGRLLPDTLLKVLGEDGEFAHEDGVHGEAYIKSSHMFAGYLHHDDLAMSADTFDVDGYYATGDIVYVKQGKIYIAGRCKDIMKVNGWQVAPEELQNVIMELQHRGIQDCAVVGCSIVNSAGLVNTVPRAYVVKAPCSTVTALDIKTHMKDRLISYKQLSGGVMFIDQIPRNATGKILRRVLQESDLVEEAGHSANIEEYGQPAHDNKLLYKLVVMLPLIPILYRLVIIIFNAATRSMYNDTGDNSDHPRKT